MRDFQGSFFYVNKNIQGDFQIYISVLLRTRNLSKSYGYMLLF